MCVNRKCELEAYRQIWAYILRWARDRKKWNLLDRAFEGTVKPRKLDVSVRPCLRGHCALEITARACLRVHCAPRNTARACLRGHCALKIIAPACSITTVRSKSLRKLAQWRAMRSTYFSFLRSHCAASNCAFESTVLSSDFLSFLRIHRTASHLHERWS